MFDLAKIRGSSDKKCEVVDERTSEVDQRQDVYIIL